MEIDKTVKYISKLAKQLKNEDSFKATVMSKLKNNLKSSINFRLENITNEQDDQTTYADLLQVNNAAEALLNNSVFSTDGSTLEADRDLPIEFAAINVGYVNINYGEDPKAEFDSALSFYPDIAGIIIKIKRYSGFAKYKSLNITILLLYQSFLKS